MLGIIKAKFALQTLAVESNIPIGGIVDEIKESRNDSIKAISYMLSILLK